MAHRIEATALVPSALAAITGMKDALERYVVRHCDLMACEEVIDPGNLGLKRKHLRVGKVERQGSTFALDRTGPH
jgi:hypothetical protein